MKYFEGKYYKHCVGDKTLAVIKSTSDDGDAVQLLWENKSYNIDNVKDCNPDITGININIKQKDLSVWGNIKYSEITPLKGDIMGWFAKLPMQCKHEIVSMQHKLSGTLLINGEEVCFDKGLGYIEGDSGKSFPSKYCWLQSNICYNTSIMLAIAQIPFGLITFRGCICAVIHDKREYIFSTYNRAKIIKYTKSNIILKQKRLTLEIEVSECKGAPLAAPDNGKMTRIIHECNTCQARFLLKNGNDIIFDMDSNQVSFEFVQ